MPRLRHRKADNEWSLAIRTRDNWTCQRCGKRYPPQENGRRRLGLDAAHIFSRRLKSVRHDLDNGVSLCTGCHLSWAHSRPLEFREWVRAWMGNERFDELEQRAKQIRVKKHDDPRTA